tara:strand:+ start:1258 stop:2604 length:1347 start_codon:yes stop_codon:yes gene_type:complete
MDTEFLELGFIFGILIITVYFHVKFDRFAVAHGPEVLTTLGILGCFTGITIALFSFNPENISESVPNLLAGIRTAFWASLAGVFGALTLRFGQRFRKVKDNKSQIAGQTASLSDVVLSINSLRDSIVGKNETNLQSEIVGFKEKSEEHFQSLQKEFKLFSDHMVENNQKAIVEALREVIKDFNAKITEQFGDNFKELNQAVSKLLSWQIQYKDELEIIKKNQQESREELEKASKNLKEIVGSAGIFSEIAVDLKSQIDYLNQNRETLNKQQKSLAEVLKHMSTVTPTFEKKTSLMLEQIEKGMIRVYEQFSANADQLVVQLAKSEKEFKTMFEETFKHSEIHIEELQKQMAKAAENLGIQMQISGNEMKKQIAETIVENQKTFKIGLEENSRIIKEGVLALDKALQKELNSSLESLGRQLAALSNRFVEDYLPLTEKLRQLVELSKKI